MSARSSSHGRNAAAWASVRISSPPDPIEFVVVLFPLPVHGLAAPGCGRDRVRWITRGNPVHDGTHGPGWVATETYCLDCVAPDAEILLECSPEVVPGMTDEEHDRQVQDALKTA